MKNIEIRNSIRKYRLRQYEVASTIGISEYSFSKWLRDELSEEKKQLILDAINKLANTEG